MKYIWNEERMSKKWNKTLTASKTDSEATEEIEYNVIVAFRQD